MASRSDVQKVTDHSSKVLQGYKFSQLVQFVEQDRRQFKVYFEMNIKYLFFC